MAAPVEVKPRLVQVNTCKVQKRPNEFDHDIQLIQRTLGLLPPEGTP